MPLTQQQALDIVLKERDYQDKNFNPDEIRPSGLTRVQEHLCPTVHLAMIASYVEDARDCWTFNKTTTNTIEANREHNPPETGSVAATQQIAKVAAMAMALRALERIGVSDHLLTKGLR
jgi:hypothetical protein